MQSGASLQEPSHRGPRPGNQGGRTVRFKGQQTSQSPDTEQEVLRLRSQRLGSCLVCCSCQQETTHKNPEEQAPALIAAVPSYFASSTLPGLPHTLISSIRSFPRPATPTELLVSLKHCCFNTYQVSTSAGTGTSLRGGKQGSAFKEQPGHWQGSQDPCSLPFILLINSGPIQNLL